MTSRQGIVATTLFLLSAAGCAPRQTPEDTAAAVQAVSAAGHHELATFISGNLDSIPTVFTPDVVAMPPNEATVHGRDSLRLWAEGMLRQFRISGRYTASSVTVSGDWAIERYDYALTMTPKAGGRATEDRGKGIHVYRRQPDGRWLIAQDVWNSDVAAPVSQH